MDRTNQMTKDCFGAVMQLRQAAPGTLPAPELVHERMRGFVDGMLRKASELGFAPPDAQDMAYAVVALMDETALGLDEPVRGYWMGNLLQFHYFQENLAGDGFFTRLETVRKDPRRQEVLRVYALCLLFGFQGRYRIRGSQLDLLSLIEAVEHELSRGQGDTETLSPQGARPNEVLKQGKQRAPLFVATGAVLLLAVLVYGGLRLALSHTVSETVAEISAWNRK